MRGAVLGGLKREGWQGWKKEQEGRRERWKTKKASEGACPRGAGQGGDFEISDFELPADPEPGDGRWDHLCVG